MIFCFTFRVDALLADGGMERSRSISGRTPFTPLSAELLISHANARAACHNSSPSRSYSNPRRSSSAGGNAYVDPDLQAKYQAAQHFHARLRQRSQEPPSGRTLAGLSATAPPYNSRGITDQVRPLSRTAYPPNRTSHLRPTSAAMLGPHSLMVCNPYGLSCKSSHAPLSSNSMLVKGTVARAT